MKRLTEYVNLKGQIETITMMNLRSRPGEVFDSVALGKVYIVTKAGKPLAVLSRLPGEQLAIRVNGNGSKEYVL